MVDGSNSIMNSFDGWSVPVSLVLTGTVLTLIVRHWQSARWSRRAMVPLVWISFAVVALSVAQTVTSNFQPAGVHLP